MVQLMETPFRFENHASIPTTCHLHPPYGPFFSGKLNKQTNSVKFTSTSVTVIFSYHFGVHSLPALCSLLDLA